MRSQLGKATALAIMGEGLGGRRDGRRAGQARLAGWGASPGSHLPPRKPHDFCGMSESRAFPRVLFPPVAPGDKLWWADQLSEKMGTCNKADGSGSVVLRNSTTLVMHMKVYDENIQLGRQWVRDAMSRGPAAGGHEQPARVVGQDSRGGSGLGSARHPQGLPFLISTEVSCRLAV